MVGKTERSCKHCKSNVAGLNVDLYQYTAEEFWKDFDKPTIVFWNKNHFLVVEGFDKNYDIFLIQQRKTNKSW